VDDIHRLIREAGRIPVERDTLYRAVRRDEKDCVMAGV
jgi:2-iminoacetate synthase ThiH